MAAELLGDEWPRAIGVIMTTMTAKLRYWEELPYVLCGLAHHDTAVASWRNVLICVIVSSFKVKGNTSSSSLNVNIYLEKLSLSLSLFNFLFFSLSLSLSLNNLAPRRNGHLDALRGAAKEVFVSLKEVLECVFFRMWTFIQARVRREGG